MLGAAAMSDARIVCVLGPARSGTSLTARALALLGVYLGPEAHLNQALDFNPRGSWEHRAIMDVNFELLTHLAGSNWRRRLPDLAPGWEHAPGLEKLARRAHEVIRRDFQGAPVWGWKHPETCPVLPFWQRILPPFQRVICLRDPADVVRSATPKFGYSPEHGVYVWLRYLRSALENSAPEDTVFVSHEDWFGGSCAPLKTLARALGAPERSKAPEVQAAVATFVDPAAGRSRRYPAACSAVPGRLLDIVRPLYEELNAERSFDRGLVERFRQACDEVAPVAREREAHARAVARERWLNRVRAAVAELRATVPAGETVILVDEEQFPHDAFREWSTVPFLEQGGRYWGPPPDSATALVELARLRENGAGFIAFGWPAFWWLEHFAELHARLRADARCVLRSDHFVVFDLLR
jgi:hypothetical protein